MLMAHAYVPQASCSGIIETMRELSFLLELLIWGPAPSLWQNYGVYVYWRLFICHNMGFRNMLVETVSSRVYSMITLGDLESHVCKFLVQAIRNLCENDWQITVIYHKANMCADNLAKVGHRLPREITFFAWLPLLAVILLFWSILLVTVVLNT